MLKEDSNHLDIILEQKVRDIGGPKEPKGPAGTIIGVDFFLWEADDAAVLTRV